MNAIVLAKGKKSRRLNLDKALLKIKNKTVIEQLLEKIEGLFAKIYLVTTSPEKFKFLERKKLQIIKDELECGPLGGIFLGLKTSDSFYNFVIGVDLVFLDQRLLSCLMKKEKNYQALIPGDQESPQPLCGIYTKSVLPVLERKITEKEYKLRGIFPEIKTEYVSEKELERFGDPEALFFNLNTLKDLEKARSRWREYDEK